MTGAADTSDDRISSGSRKNRMEPTPQPSVKNAVAKRTPPRRRAIEFRGVLRVLERDETRSYALGRFRALGGNRNRWNGIDRSAMAAALTATEDWLELEHPAWGERARIRDIRRALEGVAP